MNNHELIIARRKRSGCVSRMIYDWIGEGGGRFGVREWKNDPSWREYREGNVTGSNVSRGIIRGDKRASWGNEKLCGHVTDEIFNFLGNLRSRGRLPRFARAIEVITQKRKKKSNLETVPLNGKQISACDCLWSSVVSRRRNSLLSRVIVFCPVKFTFKRSFFLFSSFFASFALVHFVDDFDGRESFVLRLSLN